MPFTTPERAARWPGMDAEAISFLKSQGYTLHRDWSWSLPTPEHIRTDRESDAIWYLMQEWDFAGLRKAPT